MAAGARSEAVLVEIAEGVCTITLNRPSRKNAFNLAMYNAVVDAFELAASREDVVVVVLTGAGDYYSSGNDLANFSSSSGGSAGGGDSGTASPSDMASAGGRSLTRFVHAFIDFPKPMIAAVNGPAIGVAVTTLALCDIVYASETATFNTPFSQLGQSPEGVSSLIFPQLMGISKANEVLMMGKKLTAHEAERRNLVAAVFPAHSFRQEVQQRAQQLARLPPQGLRAVKKLLRSHHIDKMKEANAREVALLEKLWVSDECLSAVMDFMSKSLAKKSKL